MAAYLPTTPSYNLRGEMELTIPTFSVFPFHSVHIVTWVSFLATVPIAALMGRCKKQ